MDKSFADWLLDELKERGWSQADLARASHLSRTAISNYLSQQRSNPDEAALRAIASAFDYPPETLFRAAGLLPPLSAVDAEWEIWQAKLARLSPENRARFLRQLETELQYQDELAARSLAARRVKTGPLPGSSS
jgi:transcriptional regulator with XRE-family HTH domain